MSATAVGEAREWRKVHTESLQMFPDTFPFIPPSVKRLQARKLVRDPGEPLPGKGIQKMQRRQRNQPSEKEGALGTQEDGHRPSTGFCERPWIQRLGRQVSKREGRGGC